MDGTLRPALVVPAPASTEAPGALRADERLRVRFGDLAVELEKHSNDHIHDVKIPPTN